MGEYLTVTIQTVHKWTSCSSISIYLYIRSSTKNLSRKEMISPFAVLSVCVNVFSIVFSLAKSRAIAIPVDLDSQVNNLFVKSNNVVQKTILNWRISARNASRRDSTLTTSKDYRNIIERLQVRAESPENSQWRNVFVLNAVSFNSFYQDTFKNSIVFENHCLVGWSIIHIKPSSILFQTLLSKMEFEEVGKQEIPSRNSRALL